MASWETHPLGNVLTFQRGFDITKAEQREGPYWVISSSGPKSTNEQFKVEGPGVIIGRKGSLGTVFYSEANYWPHDTTLWVKDFHGNDPRFAYYYLQTMGLERLDAGSSNPSLNRNHIHTIPVRWPSLPIQRRIAGILSAYDDLIENSQRRIKILEEMARRLYREWFVHFRFPGHEDCRFVESPLGEIPEGWEVSRLGELISINKGISYSGAGLTEEGNPMVNLKNIEAGGGFRRDAAKPYSGDYKSRHTVAPGDVVIANTDLTQAGNVVASPALIPRLPLQDGQEILISHHLYAVRPVQAIPLQFIYHLMLTDGFRGYAKGFAIGTTVLGLPKKGVESYCFACPPASLIRNFVKHVSPIHGQVEVLNHAIDNLRRTRDLLLPRLLSGQIDVEALDHA
jgi:type I restriction enzyme S subunit